MLRNTGIEDKRIIKLVTKCKSHGKGNWDDDDDEEKMDRRVC
jgi:hypothetical protein